MLIFILVIKSKEKKGNLKKTYQIQMKIMGFVNNSIGSFSNLLNESKSRSTEGLFFSKLFLFLVILILQIILYSNLAVRNSN